MNASPTGESRSWRIAKLGDICAKITDGTHHSPPNRQTGDFKYVTAKNIRPSGLDLADITYVDAATHREIYSRCDVRKDDILYVKDGATAGRVALNALDEEFSLLSSVGVLRPNRDFILPKYLLYALQAPMVKDRMLADVAGVAITRLTLKKLKAAEIPLAPLDQQGSIVAELEKQFSRLDEAVANLKRVKANLKRYKAGVLKAAVEGRLVPTEADIAGREGRSYETGDQLLERIAVTVCRSMRAARKSQPPRESGRDLSFDLPEGWSVAPIAHLAEVVEYGSSAKTIEADAGVPVLRMGNIVDGDLDLSTLKYLPDSHEEFPRLLLRPGDLLFNRTNSPELVGKTAVFKGRPERCSFASYLIRVRLAPGCLPEFVSAFINSIHGRRWVKDVATQQVGQANVNGTKLQNRVVPIPPLAEQERIVTELDAHLTQVRVLLAETDANLQRAHLLRSAVLTKTMGSL